MPADPSTDLLVLTGASGKQCAHLLPFLYNTWKNLRLVVNSASSEARLTSQYPNAQVVRADLTDSHAAKKVLEDATAIYYVGPPFHPHETEMGYTVIDAAIEEAKKGNFKHFVYSSVLNSQIRKMMNHDCKRYVEEYLIESGLNYTILSPSHFMDMFPLNSLLSQTIPKPVLYASWNPDIPFSFLALRDLGECSAKVITEREKHYLAQYPLCSDGPYTYREVCGIVGKEMGKEIEISPKEYTESVDGLLKMITGLGTGQVHPYTRDATQRMLLYYNHHGLLGTKNVLEWLLERKPTDFQQWTRLGIEAHGHQ